MDWRQSPSVDADILEDGRVVRPSPHRPSKTRMEGAVMGDRLGVDPIDLHLSSDHMDMHHAELRAAHGAADGVIDEAQAGWVGTSATALQSKMAEWQATTARLCGDIASHGAAYRAAANAYAGNDSDAAKALDRTL
jgi:WXG100 family type VII secretion target